MKLFFPTIMPNNVTILKIDSKTISIKTKKQENIRVSAIIFISGYWNKLKPYDIFKGEINRKIFKLLSDLEFVKNKKLFINVNKNSWTTNVIIKD